MITVGTTNEAERVFWIKQQLGRLPTGARLLDAGAGEQRYRPFCSHLTYVAQDFAQYDPSAEASGLQVQQWNYGALDIVSDITAIPEPDQSFDAVLCSEVLEHIPYPDRALKEFGRLLRRGGTLILTAPFCSLTHFAPFHFATGFSRYFYEKHLTENDFAIQELASNGNYFEYIAQEVRRLPSIGARYAGRNWLPFTGIAIQVLLRSLARLSRADGESSQLLCFGWHVLAKKR